MRGATAVSLLSARLLADGREPSRTMFPGARAGLRSRFQVGQGPPPSEPYTMTAHVRIAALINALKAGEPLAAEDARWLGSSLESERPLRALGLTRSPGQRSLATIAATELRNQLLREAAEKHFPGFSKSKQAETLFKGLQRYRCSAWERERSEVECPLKRLGKPEDFYWRILKARDRQLSAKTISIRISH